MKSRFLVLAFLPVMSLTHAADISRIDAQVDRLLRRDPSSRPSGFALLETTSTVNNTFSSGVAYTDGDDDSDSWELPLYYSYAFSGKDKVAILTGVLTTDDGHTQSGLDDVTLSYKHSFDISTYSSKLSASSSLAVIVPSGGKVGSSAATQILRGSLAYAVSNTWTIGGDVGLAHVDGLSGNVDSTGIVLSTMIAYGDGTHGADIKLTQRHRGGAKNTATFEAEYDFASRFGISPSLTFDHGLTEGHRDNTIELDLAKSW